MENIKPAPLVCPGCGNTDPEKMRLYLVDLTWNRYYPTGGVGEYGAPVFEWGKWTHSEISDEHEPTVGCEECDAEWNVDWRDFDLG